MGKLTKRDYKRILPEELYANYLLAKRGKAKATRHIGIKLYDDEFRELTDLLDKLSINRSSFLRYAIRQAKANIESMIEEEEQTKS